MQRNIYINKAQFSLRAREGQMTESGNTADPIQNIKENNVAAAIPLLPQIAKGTNVESLDNSILMEQPHLPNDNAIPMESKGSSYRLRSTEKQQPNAQSQLSGHSSAISTPYYTGSAHSSSVITQRKQSNFRHSQQTNIQYFTDQQYHLWQNKEEMPASLEEQEEDRLQFQQKSHHLFRENDKTEKLLSMNNKLKRLSINEIYNPNAFVGKRHRRQGNDVSTKDGTIVRDSFSTERSLVNSFVQSQQQQASGIIISSPTYEQIIDRVRKTRAVSIRNPPWHPQIVNNSASIVVVNSSNELEKSAAVGNSSTRRNANNNQSGNNNNNNNNAKMQYLNQLSLPKHLSHLNSPQEFAYRRCACTTSSTTTTVPSPSKLQQEFSVESPARNFYNREHFCQASFYQNSLKPV